MSQLTAYYWELQQMILKKETFLLPHYLSKRLDIDFHFYYGYNGDIADLPEQYREAQLHDYKHKHMNHFIMLYDMIRTMLCNASKTKCAFFIHISSFSMAATLLYKVLNSKGFVIVRADLEEEMAKILAKHDFVFSKGLLGYTKRKLASYFFKNAIVTVGNYGAYKALHTMYDRHGWTNLLHVHPALDNELFESLGLKYRKYEEKENVFLYVGRIGNHQKNTDMMLEAIEKTDLKDWKFYLIGPMTNSFDVREKSDYGKRISKLYERRPDLKNKVIFTGPISDTKTLFEYYLRAKVFVLSSRHEGFANVLSEAAALGCYVVSTDVGGASIASNDWQFGTKIIQEDSSHLASVLTDIVKGNLKIDPTKAMKREYLTWSYMINRVIDLMEKNN